MIPIQLKNLKFCRIKRGTKKPFEKEWTNKPYTYDEILNFLPEENYGVLCGYENLAVIDCDKEVLQLAIDSLLPETFKVRTGGGGTHNYFFIPELKQKIILEADNIHLGEVQSYGTQVVGSGSIHPSGNKYEPLNKNEITTLKLEELYSVIGNFMKQVKENEEFKRLEVEINSEIDNLDVEKIWGTTGLKKHGNEYYGEHPIHGSEGGMNFWVNPSKNTWHCFRCNSGGGPLSAIGVKEGIIDCSDAHRGILRGAKAFECIKIAKEKYGLKDNKIEFLQNIPTQITKEDEIPLIWDNELEKWEEEEQDWIIEKLIPKRAVVILTGKRGTLKTFIALLMAYAVATGNQFLDNFNTQKGTVVYLDKENGVSIMKKRTSMIKTGLSLEDKNIKVGFICFSQLKIDKLSDISKIEDLIKKHIPKLLIIDTYRRGISFDENDASAVSELFVDILRPLVEKYNLSIILIHHNRKGSGGEVPDEMDEIRGSSDLANYADIIFKMERPKGDGGILVLKQLKNRNAQEEKPMQIKAEFTEDYIKMEYKGEFEKRTQADKCVDILTIWIAEHGIESFTTQQAKEIAFKAGIKETNFKNALNLMVDCGVIENNVRGVYTIPNNKVVVS